MEQAAHVSQMGPFVILHEKHKQFLSLFALVHRHRHILQLFCTAGTEICQTRLLLTRK